MKHEKKVLPKFFEDILNGNKTFELRLADWDCQSGDILILKEWSKENGYTGREIAKQVGYILKTKDLRLFSEREVEQYGYQVISLKDLN
jgi:hypothetical protein